MRPGRTLFLAVAAAAALGAASCLEPVFLDLWAALCVLAAIFAAADGIVLYFFTATLAVTRNMETSLAIGRVETVELAIRLRGKGLSPGTVSVFDVYDDLFDCDAFPAAAPVADGEAVLRYRLLPAERGDWEMTDCDVLSSSPLRFWRLRQKCPCVTRGRIYPDFRMIAASGGISALIEAAGQKNSRRRGLGLEFDRLRDWQVGDTIRAVDWRATSRRGKVITREYVEEQDQQVLFILDSGYRLHRRTEAGVGSHAALPATQFDSALNAAIFLAWSALKAGDAVAASVFGNTERWIPPRRGLSSLPHLLNALYDAKSASCPSSIEGAVEQALGRLRRRTFIVVISNFRQEDEQPLARVLAHTARRHLLLLANIREEETEILAAGTGSDEAILLAASAEAYLHARKRLMTRWERMGMLTLESAASTLTAKLVNSYLEVKRSGTL